MSIICPTVLASSPKDYQDQIEAVQSFTSRIQIDLGDGQFTTKSIPLAEAWWPDGMEADIHLMYARPEEYLSDLMALRPSLIILHAEAAGDLFSMMQRIKHSGTAAGIAILQNTKPEDARELVGIADHALIFSGNLGSFGGKADLSLLRKVPALRQLNQSIEIGWDGGANETNAAALAKGGVDVINVGSAIQKALRPENAYRTLRRCIES